MHRCGVKPLRTLFSHHSEGGPGMRRFGIVFALSALALVTFSLMGSAQQGGKKGKGGFGGGMGKMDPLQLLRMEDVKKELDLSEEQSEKLPGAVMKARSEERRVGKECRWRGARE